MKKLIMLLEEKIEFIETSMQDIENAVNAFIMDKNMLELLIMNPDIFNMNILKVSKENLYKAEYIEKLKGWFKECPDESQIQIALNYLKELIGLYKIKINDYIFLSNKLYKKYECNKNYYEDLLKKIESYDKNTYIEERELLAIEEVLNEDEIDEEIISAFSCIGKNNALIKLKREQGKSLFETANNDLDIDLFEAMDCDRDIEQNNVEFVLKKVDNILSNFVSIYSIVGDIQIVEEVKECFERLLSIKNKITNEMVEEAEIFKEEIEIIDNPNVFILAVSLLLIDSIEENKSDDIVTILEKYKNSKYGKKIESFEMQLVQLKKDKLKNIIDEYYIEEEYVKFSSSYSEIPELELVKFVGIETIQSMKIMKLINLYYKDIDNMTSEQLDNLINNLENEIYSYKNIQNNLDSQINEESIEGLNIDDVLNYVVFLDTERIQHNIETLIRNYDIKSSVFAAAIYKLCMIPQTDLFNRNTCKPIMESAMKPNEYEIREERSGAIRVCFKVITNCNGHAIYEILGFAFGSCGDKKKNDNLKASIKEYVDYYSKYQDFEQLFKGNDIKQIDTIINQGLNLYNQLINKEKEKKLGE